jgi:tetratricopeptide (TPR) repeat protein
MKFIRWLLSNIILIAFVLALTYAYVYWDNLTGEDTPAGKLIAYLSTEYEEVNEFLTEYGLTGDEPAEVAATEPVEEVTEPTVAPQVTPQPQSPAQATSQAAIPPQAMVQQAPPRRPVRQAPTWPGVQERSVQPVPRAPYPQPGTRQPTYTQPQMPPRQQRSEPSLVQEQLPTLTTADDDQMAAEQEPASSTRELWISAREEFHRGNIDVSIRNYKEVIATSADNYDAYGELGNVYLSRGSQKEAAEAYFAAAAILVKTGQIDRAQSLLPMLGRLDRAKAEELNRLIRRSAG